MTEERPGPSLDIWIMSAFPARRNRLQRMIGDDGDIRVVATAATFPFLRSLIAETAADLAVVDLQSPVDSTILRDWMSELIDLVAIVVLSPEPDPLILNLMLNAKAGGVLPADAAPEQIVLAIKSVACGLMIIDPTIVSAHLTPGTHQEGSTTEPLTPREREVLALLADGLGNKEIAARLEVSEHTIKFHIRSILGKLGASSRTEAVSRGLRSGLIEL